jgi:hypothetical protein
LAILIAMSRVRKTRPAAKLIEEKVEQQIAQATDAVQRAREVVSEARKLVHKTYAVRDQARAVRAKKRA